MKPKAHARKYSAAAERSWVQGHSMTFTVGRYSDPPVKDPHSPDGQRSQLATTFGARMPTNLLNPKS